MKITKQNIKSILLIAFCVILMLVGIMRIDVVFDAIGFVFKVISPIIIGFCIAFILNIPVRFFEQTILSWFVKKNHLRIARLLSVLLTVTLFLAIISLLMLFIIPQIVETISAIVYAIPAFTDRAITFSQKYLDKFGITSQMITDLLLDSKNILTTVGSFLKDNVGSFWSFGTTVVAGVINVFLGIFCATYFLFDKEKVMAQIKRLLRSILKPAVYNYTSHAASVSSRSFSNFISGQLIEACILGVLCFIGMLIFRIPYALVVSTLIGVFALIPILGAWVGAAISAALILISSPVKALWFIIFIVVLQQIEGNLIYPRVVGKQVGLPGVWVLLSIIVGSGFYGATGALIAVPLTSVVYTLVAEFVVSKERAKAAESEEQNTQAEEQNT